MDNRLRSREWSKRAGKSFATIAPAGLAAKFAWSRANVELYRLLTKLRAGAVIPVADSWPRGRLTKNRRHGLKLLPPPCRHPGGVVQVPEVRRRQRVRLVACWMWQLAISTKASFRSNRR